MKAYDLTLSFSSLTTMFSLADDHALLLNVLNENTASSMNSSFISYNYDSLTN
jgi:predicted transcriptional regulator